MYFSGYNLSLLFISITVGLDDFVRKFEMWLIGGKVATINVCDICGSRKDVARRSYQTGTTYNGIDHDVDSEIFDLCVNCERNMLNESANFLLTKHKLTYHFNSTMIDKIRLAQKHLRSTDVEKD